MSRTSDLLDIANIRNFNYNTPSKKPERRAERQLIQTMVERTLLARIWVINEINQISYLLQYTRTDMEPFDHTQQTGLIVGSLVRLAAGEKTPIVVHRYYILSIQPPKEGGVPCVHLAFLDLTAGITQDITASKVHRFLA